MVGSGLATKKRFHWLTTIHSDNSRITFLFSHTRTTVRQATRRWKLAHQNQMTRKKSRRPDWARIRISRRDSCRILAHGGIEPARSQGRPRFLRPLVVLVLDRNGRTILTEVGLLRRVLIPVPVRTERLEITKEMRGAVDRMRCARQSAGPYSRSARRIRS